MGNQGYRVCHRCSGILEPVVTQGSIQRGVSLPLTGDSDVVVIVLVVIVIPVTWEVEGK